VSEPAPPPTAEQVAEVERLEQRSAKEILRTIWPRLLFLAIAGVTLYVLWPSLIAVFRSWPELLKLNPAWYPVMLGLEAASFVCAWGLQRVALRTHRWFAIATSQLGGNAVSRVVPGGAAAGGAMQFKMLSDAGVSMARAGSGLTVASLISTGTLFALPILSLPAALAGRRTPAGLAQAAWLGALLFAVAFAAGWVLYRHEGALRAVARWIQWVRNRLFRSRSPRADLPDVLVRERAEIRDSLEDTWWMALLFALGNWLFDYLALLAALAAAGARPRPTLVLLAYTASMVLAMIPITPGGLGFVEAGLTGLLALAGVSGGQAALATLTYRLVSYWLPLPLGAAAIVAHRRRYARRAGHVVPDGGPGA
jgi:uncharacterized protein (TIRG00374 family)